VLARYRPNPNLIEPATIVHDDDVHGVARVGQLNREPGGLGVANNVANRLLHDTKYAHLRLQRSSDYFARRGELRTQLLLILHGGEQSAHRGDQPELIESGGPQFSSDITQTLDYAEQLCTNGAQALDVGWRINHRTQRLHAARELDQPLERIVVDLSGDTTTFFLLGPQHLARPRPHLGSQQALFGHILPHDLAQRASS
jgi:hypothetical protein